MSLYVQHSNPNGLDVKLRFICLRFVRLAFSVSAMSKDQNAVALGRKGGNARAKKLTRERRIEIARQGYHASPLSSKRAKVQPNEEIPENKVEESSCA